MKRPAYGNAVFARRRAREVLWLLVVGVGRWQAGDGLFARPDLSRIVVLDDLDLTLTNLDFVAGLDVLVVDESELVGRGAAVSAALLTAGRANTVWRLSGVQVDEMTLLGGEAVPLGLSPVRVGDFPAALARQRERMALFGQGIWQGRESPQLAAMMEQLRGGNDE